MAPLTNPMNPPTTAKMTASMTNPVKKICIHRLGRIHKEIHA